MSRSARVLASLILFTDVLIHLLPNVAEAENILENTKELSDKIYVTTVNSILAAGEYMINLYEDEVFTSNGTEIKAT